MDTVATDSKSLAHRLNASDRGRLDQYLTVIREVERRMIKSREWIKHPKPKAPFPLPDEPSARSKYIEKTRLIYKIASLAFLTDWTRSISLLLDSNNCPTIHVDGATTTCLIMVKAKVNFSS